MGFLWAFAVFLVIVIHELYRNACQYVFSLTIYKDETTVCQPVYQQMGILNDPYNILFKENDSKNNRQVKLVRQNKKLSTPLSSRTLVDRRFFYGFLRFFGRFDTRIKDDIRTRKCSTKGICQIDDLF